jgi:hypothetical protein
MRIPVLMLLLGIVFISCKSNNDSNLNFRETLIRVDNSAIDSLSDISSIISSVSVLKLNESVGSYIGEAFDIKTTSRKEYLIFDYKTDKILAFNSEGNFIKVLSKSGDGPNDLLKIGNFWTTDKNEIEVYDFAQMKIFTYDSLLNFKYQKRSKRFFHFNNLNKVPNSTNYIAYADFNMMNEPFDNEYYHEAILDTNLAIKSTFDIYPEKLQGILTVGYKNHFIRFSDSLRFVKSNDNHVYDITDSGVIGRFKIKYSKHTLPDDVTSILNKNLGILKNRSVGVVMKRSLIFKDYTRLFEEWLEDDKYAYFSSIEYKNDMPILFYSIYSKAKNSIICNSKKIAELKNYKLIFPTFQFFDWRNNEFIGIISGLNLKKNLLPNSQLQKDVDGNPESTYLVKIKLK